MKRLKFVREVCGDFGARQVPGDVCDVENDVTANYLIVTGSAIETDDELADGEEES